MRHKIRLIRHRFFKRALWRTRLIFWGGAVLVGCVAAVFAIVADDADHFFRHMVAYNKYLPLIVSPLGMVITLFFTRRYFAGSEGSGIPQALVAMHKPGGALTQRLLSMRVVIGKILMCLLGLLSGASIGREGPTVHLGSAVMYSIGRFANLPGEYMERGLIMAGGGAGIAAAFNTPLAGIIFTIEELARSFDRRSSSLIVIAVLLAGLTALLVHEHNYDYYGTIPAQLDFTWVWPAAILCGVVGGLMGGAFSQMLVSGSKWLAPRMRKHWIWIALGCGFSIAILGFISNGLSYGSGYIEASSIVTCAGKTTCNADMGLMYPVYKLFATVASYLSGIPGGIFAPSLAVGAGLGSDFAALFPPALTSSVVVLGMVAYFSGVVQAPITAFVIVMEMTDNHNLLLAMMTASLLATGASKIICPIPIYHALAENYVRALTKEKVDDIEKERAESEKLEVSESEAT